MKIEHPHAKARGRASPDAISAWLVSRIPPSPVHAALVTLAEARGSSPREAGARMIVRPDGGFSGTIGGGALEWIALAEAQALLADRVGPPLRRIDKALGPDLGQCCGGRVIVTLERFEASDRDLVATLADLERAGPLVTVAKSEGKRLARRVASARSSSESL